MDWKNLPSLGALRAFQALAETGSYTAAGAALNVSHAAISQQVRALEDRLGVELVSRAGRRGTLTPEGERLAAALATAFLGIATCRRRTDWRRCRAPAAGHHDRGLRDGLADAAAVGVPPRASRDRDDAAPDGAVRRAGAGRHRRGGALRRRRLARARRRAAASDHHRHRRRAVADRRRGGSPSRATSSTCRGCRNSAPAEMSDWLRDRGVIAPRKENVDAPARPPGARRPAQRRRRHAHRPLLIEREIAAGRLSVLFEDALPGHGYYIVTRPGVMRPPLKAFVSWLRRHARRDPLPQRDTAQGVRNSPPMGVPFGRKPREASRP